VGVAITNANINLKPERITCTLTEKVTDSNTGRPLYEVRSTQANANRKTTVFYKSNLRRG